MISYARNCLFLDAGIEINLNLDNIIPLDSKAPKLNRYISELLREKKKHGENHFMAYVNLVLELLKAQPSESVMHCLLEAVALATDTVAPALVDKLTWLKVSRWYYSIVLCCVMFCWRCRCWYWSPYKAKCMEIKIDTRYPKSSSFFYLFGSSLW